MPAGQLSERIELQRATRTDDGYGGYAETWATYATVWAQVRPLSGRERYHAQQIEAEASYRVTIRYRADVLDSDRIVWRGQNLNIRFRADAGPREPYLMMDVEVDG